MKKSSLVVVSNRLPVTVKRGDDGQLVFSESNGGLATAINSLGNTAGERIWIGWPAIATDDLRPGEKALITRKLKERGCAPVFLSKAQIAGFYDGYSNDTLWPLFHYFQSTAVFNPDNWKTYQAVNQLYSRTVLRYAEAGSTVWVHDYHLMLLPALLRDKLPSALIGFFLHTPFPSFEIFRLLPERKAILQGLLGADLLGFHINDYVRHFTSSVLRILGHRTTRGTILADDHAVVVDAFPIGIDYDRFADSAVDPEVIQERDTIDARYHGQKLILSVDRLDYSKGIPRRLDAFEHFLATNPKLHKKISLFVLAVPSRIDVASYQRLRDTVEQQISRINGQYGSVDWTPIAYQFKNLPFTQVAGLYGRADVMLVTPLRDGMNLVAKEYVASQSQQQGVLVLSELTGAADELPEAVRINPNDLPGTAEAIYRALTMPKAEKQRRLQAMQDRLKLYTVKRWANDFLEQLNQTKQTEAGRRAKLMTTYQRTVLADDFKAAKRRAVFLDYDGTLMHYVDSPDPVLATPPRRLINVLTQLTNQANTDVAIVSGRPRHALERWFTAGAAAKLPLTLVAEHGAWLRTGNQWRQDDVSLRSHREDILAVMRRYADRTPGAVIEEKNFAIVWHYRNVPPELAYARNIGLRHELNSLLEGSDITAYSGEKIIEVRPGSIGKGSAMEELLALSPADFVLCIGDDYTDEDMFRMAPETAYTIRVGLEDTDARYQLSGVDQVLNLLRTLKS